MWSVLEAERHRDFLILICLFCPLFFASYFSIAAQRFSLRFSHHFNLFAHFLFFVCSLKHEIALVSGWFINLFSRNIKYTGWLRSTEINIIHTLLYLFVINWMIFEFKSMESCLSTCTKSAEWCSKKRPPTRNRCQPIEFSSLCEAYIHISPNMEPSSHGYSKFNVCGFFFFIVNWIEIVVCEHRRQRFSFER